MTSHIIEQLPTHVELAHDTRGWMEGEIVPVDHWMFISTMAVSAAVYPVIRAKPPHTVDAVLYDMWYPAAAPEPLYWHVEDAPRVEGET